MSTGLSPDPRVQRRQHPGHHHEPGPEGGHQSQRVGRVLELVREGAVLPVQTRLARLRRAETGDHEERPRQEQGQSHGEPRADPCFPHCHLTTERVADAPVAVQGDDDEDAIGGECAEEREEAEQAAGEVRGEGEVEAEIGDLGRHGDEADDEVEHGQAHDEEILRGHAELNPVHVDRQAVTRNPHRHQHRHVYHGGAHHERESLVLAPQIPGCVIVVSVVVDWSLGVPRRQVLSFARLMKNGLGSPTERVDVM